MPQSFPEPIFRHLSRDDETINRLLTVRCKLTEWREIAAIDHLLGLLDQSYDREYALWFAQWLEQDRKHAVAHLMQRMPCPCRDSRWFEWEPACRGDAAATIQRALDLMAAADEPCLDKRAANHARRCGRFAAIALDEVAKTLTPPPVRPLSHPRDWVAEARCLANGADTMAIERGHLVAIFDLIEERDKVIRELMRSEGKAA